MRAMAPASLTILLLVGAVRAQSKPADPSTSWLGINLAGPVDWNTELPFVDVFRLARAWISNQEGRPWGQGPALELDAHGWVKRLEPGAVAVTPMCTIEGGHYPAGEYTVLYDGEGEINIWPNHHRVTSRQPGRLTFVADPSRGGFFLQIVRTDPANYVRHLRVLMPGFEATYRESPFHPAFLERWADFNTYRFMDWMHTNGQTAVEWADRPTLDDATWTVKGVPVEVMVDLCNRQRVNPWFCIPHMASDDYVRQFAGYVKAHLDPTLRVYIEYSNEVWNGIFAQARWAQERAKELGLGPPERPWEGAALFYTRRALEIFALFEDAFGGHERLVRVLAWQAAASPDYWTDGLVLQRGQVAGKVDALAIAPYISVLVPARSDRPDTVTADQMATWTVDQVLDYTEQRALPQCIGWMQAQKAVCDKYGLKLLAYEAGQHLVGVGGGENNEALTRLFIEANAHPRMGAIYTRYLDAWEAVGGDLCCLFSSVSRWSKWGSWGLCQYYDEAEADQPKLAAVMAWNRQHRRR